MQCLIVTPHSTAAWLLLDKKTVKERTRNWRGSWIKIAWPECVDEFAGHKLDLLIIDEATHVPNSTWVALQPLIRGRAVALGTLADNWKPRKHWFTDTFIEAAVGYKTRWKPYVIRWRHLCTGSVKF